MSATATGPNGHGASQSNEIIISADSHVMEPHDLWTERMPAALRDQAPTYPPHKVGEGFQQHAGGTDPNARLTEMAQDGVSAEVLYPTLGLNQFGIENAAVQEAAFRIYNDWLIDYCQVAPDRLVGIPSIAIYDVDHAIKELERCTKAGLQGALIWNAPHPDLPFHSDHYNKFWDAAQALDAPVSFHILTGHDYSRDLTQRNVESYRGSVNLKLSGGANTLFDLMFYGILDRYPRLKTIMVEFECGWLPFYYQQWGYYYRSFRGVNPPPMQKDPREYFGTQVLATFFNDAVGAHLFDLNPEAYMWSNDYPHPNSTWPHSRDVIERDLGHLSAEKRAMVVRENCIRLYNMRVPAAV